MAQSEGSELLQPLKNNGSSSPSSPSALGERSGDLSTENMDLGAEEFMLAHITGANPLGYVTSAFTSWCRAGFSTSEQQDDASLQTSGHATSGELRLSWAAVCSIALLKTLLLFAKPFDILSNIVEFFLNLMYMNHSVGHLLYTFLFDRGSFKMPRSGNDDYYSLVGLIDPRQDLQVQEDILSDASMLLTDEGMKNMADICTMAAKISYENEKVIRKVVESWKMNFVKYFDCWNDYLASNSTQGFIFTDKKQDANIVVVAFRGTQPFNMYDWCTDFDFSYYVLPKVGRVHVGFLEGLGLGSRLKRETLYQAKTNAVMKKNKLMSQASPTSGLDSSKLLDSSKVLAYDAMCSELRILLAQNAHAKIYFTGHSLGAALATLFTGLLLIEDNDMCSRFGATFTFGQPRVGDRRFGQYMEKKLCATSPRQYFRVVYKTDIVPRLPFDDALFQFKHIAPCHYYKSVFKSMALSEEPYKNLMSVAVQPMPHVEAMWELFTSVLAKATGVRVRGYTETNLAVMMRMMALICPGLCAHIPTNYVDAVRRAPSSFLQVVSQHELASNI